MAVPLLTILLDKVLTYKDVQMHAFQCGDK